MKKDALVPLGNITRHQGLKGAFRVRAQAVESENLNHLATVYIDFPEQGPTACPVRHVQERKGFFVLQVDRIANVDQVTPLVGREVLARREDLLELEQGEFYWFELIGLEVICSDGRTLGKVAAIFPTGANDVLDVRQGQQEWLIPYIDDVIVDIDTVKGVITIDPLPGLLD